MTCQRSVPRVGVLLLLVALLGAAAVTATWVSRAEAIGGGRPDIHVSVVDTYNFPDDGNLASFHVAFHNDGGLSAPFYVKIFLDSAHPASFTGVSVEQTPGGSDVTCQRLSSIALRCDVSGLEAESGDVVVHLDMVSTDVRGGSDRGTLAAASFGPYNDKDDTNNVARSRFFVFED